MPGFSLARRKMVDGQIRPSAVTDPRLIAAMLDVPRERFAPKANAALAYLDLDLPVGPQGSERRMLKPAVLAKLIQALAVREGERVLVVGVATGYAAALLVHLGAVVTGLDDSEPLLAEAREALAGTGVSLVCGPLAEGWVNGGPYDAILVAGASEIRPEALLRQLRDGGRLAVVEGRGPAGRAMLYISDNGEIGGRPIFDAAAPVLPGFTKPAVFSF